MSKEKVFSVDASRTSLGCGERGLGFRKIKKLGGSICRNVNIGLSISGFRKVDIRLPGKGNSNAHGARPVH